MHSGTHKPPSTSPLRALPASRLGFHYFPDTLHYREVDLQAWLPELSGLGAGWLVLRSELNRAIPEYFLRGLQLAGIAPIIQFPLPLDRLPDLKEAQTLFEVYARWGARHLILFDRPNARASWQATHWAQQELVERFLDRYLPLANLLVQMGLTPVFSPLEPGGSYWDTAFLRSALQVIQRRKQETLLQNMALAAYAWRERGPQPAGLPLDAGGGNPGPRSLDWGAGGPERWPLARPYLTPEGSQDQLGFRIYDWYTAIARSVLQHACPVILLQAGLPGDPLRMRGLSTHTPADMAAYTSIAHLLAGETVADPLDAENELEAIPEHVIAANFWLLSADPASPWAGQAFLQGGSAQQPRTATPSLEALRALRRPAQPAAEHAPEGDLPIRHYLLLPDFEWGVSDWYLEVIRPFIKKHRPTVGFSPEEAQQAARVTVAGNLQNFPEDLLNRLQAAGCQVEQINGDGTNIAMQFAQR